MATRKKSAVRRDGNGTLETAEKHYLEPPTHVEHASHLT